MDGSTVPTWNQNTTGTASNITASSNSTITSLTNSSGLALSGALSGTSASFSSTTASSSYTTGALVVGGGVGVAGAINTATDITINKGWVYAGVGANTNGNRYGINLYSYDAGAQYSGTMQMDYVTNPILHISTTGNYIQIDNATQFLNNVWSNNGQIRIESSSSGYVALYNGSTTRLGYMGNSTTNFAFTAENSANFTFTGASNFCLTSSGNMGLGTTNPDFASTGNMCLTLQGQSTRARINLQNSSTSTSGVAGTVSAWNGTTYLGSLDFGADGATNSSYLNGYVANAGSVINWINVNHTGAATFSSSVTANGQIIGTASGASALNYQAYGQNNYVGYELKREVNNAATIGIYLESGTTNFAIGNKYIGGGNSLTISTTDGHTTITSTTASTSYTTGALIVGGGVGVAGAAYFNSTMNVAGYLTAAGGAGTSDKRLKDTTVFNFNLSQLDNLHVYQYHWNKQSGLEQERNHYSVFAQEVEKIAPDLVFTANDSMGKKSVNFTELHTLEIERLKQRISEQNDRIERLEKAVFILTHNVHNVAN